MKNLWKSILAGVLAGAIVIAAFPAIAENIEAVFNSVNVSLDGKTFAKTGDSYELANGTKVPFSILYEGTTYLPVRKLSELLGVGIDWDGDSRTVLIEQKKEEKEEKPDDTTPSTGPKTKELDLWLGAPNFTEFYGLKTLSEISTVHSTTFWYDVSTVKSTDEYVEKLEADGFKRVEDEEILSRFKVWRKGDVEVWLDPGLYTKLVYGVTVCDLTRPVCGRKYSYLDSRESVPSFSEAYGFYPATSNDKVLTYVGETDLWSCIPDYLKLLQQEGFLVGDISKTAYGKTIKVRKERSSVTIGFAANSNSTIPNFFVAY